MRATSEWPPYPSRLLLFADPGQPTAATETRLQLRVVVNRLHELAERVPVER